MKPLWARGEGRKRRKGDAPRLAKRKGGGKKDQEEKVGFTQMGLAGQPRA